MLKDRKDNREKTSAELKREEKAQKMVEARKYAMELDRLFNQMRARFKLIEKSGEIPDDGLLRGYRKKLQDLISGINKLRRAGTAPSFSQGQVNVLSSMLKKWMYGDKTAAAKQPEVKQKKNRSEELGEILRRIQYGSSVGDPALREAIRLLRDIARDKIMSGSATLVAKRASRLMAQQKKSEIEIENYIKDKFVVPILSKVFEGFVVVLEANNVQLDEDVRNYVETCLKGAKSRKEYINLLLERQTTFHQP